MLSTVPLAGWACALLAGLAVFLAIRSPARPWRRVAGARTELVEVSPLSRLLTGRDDSAPFGRRMVMATAGSGAVCSLIVGLAGGPGQLTWLALPVLAPAAAVGLGWLEPLAARRREQVLVLQAPQALELLSACLVAGMPIRVACSAVVNAFDGPVAEDLSRVLAVACLGVSDAEAWRSLQGHTQLGPAAVDLARSVESGTMMVESLRRHAEVARERRRAALQVLARGVGVRSVMPLMLCFIPAFMLLGVVPTVVSAVTRALG